MPSQSLALRKDNSTLPTVTSMLDGDSRFKTQRSKAYNPCASSGNTVPTSTCELARNHLAKTNSRLARLKTPLRCRVNPLAAQAQMQPSSPPREVQSYATCTFRPSRDDYLLLPSSSSKEETRALPMATFPKTFFAETIAGLEKNQKRPSKTQKAASPPLSTPSSEEVTSQMFWTIKRPRMFISEAISNLPQAPDVQDEKFDLLQSNLEKMDCADDFKSSKFVPDFSTESPSQQPPSLLCSSCIQSLEENPSGVVEFLANQPLLNLEEDADSLPIFFFDSQEDIGALLSQCQDFCMTSNPDESVEEKLGTTDPVSDGSSIEELPEGVLKHLHLLKAMITEIDGLHRQENWIASLQKAEEMLAAMADLSSDQYSLKLYALFYKADALKYLLRFEESIAVADQILNLIQNGSYAPPDLHFPVLIGKSVSLAAVKRWVESLDCAKCALEIDPHHFLALSLQGFAECKLKQWGSAFTTSSKILIRDPRNLNGLLIRTRAFAGQAQWEGVLNMVHSIRVDYPLSIETFVLEAGALLHTEKYSESLEAIARAIEMQPNNAEALKCKKNILTAISDLYIQRNNYKAALQFLDAALGLFPSSLSLLQKKILVLKALHIQDQTLGLCQAALELCQTALGLCEQRLCSSHLSQGNRFELEQQRNWLIQIRAQLTVLI